MVDPRFAFNGASSVPNTAPPPPRLAGGIIKNDVAEELMNQETESRFQRQITNHQLQSTAKDPFTKSLPLGRPTDDTQRQLESEITASQRVKPQFNTPKEKRGLFDRVGAAFTDAFDSTITRNVKGLTRGLIGTTDSALSFAEMIGFNKGPAKDEIAGARSHLQEWRDNLQVEDPTFVDTLAEGAGSALAFFIPGGAVMKGSNALMKAAHPTAARWFGASASAFLEASAEAGGVFEEGQRNGMTESEAKMAGWKTFAANAVLVGVTNRFSLFGDQKKLVKRALNNMASEGLQEFLQQVTSNVTLEKGDWDEGAYQAAGIGAILAPILGAVDIADGPQPTKAQQFAEATTPEAILENYGIVLDALHDEGLIQDKRYGELQKRRGELQLKQDSKGREGIEIPKAPEQRFNKGTPLEIEAKKFSSAEEFLKEFEDGGSLNINTKGNSLTREIVSGTSDIEKSFMDSIRDDIPSKEFTRVVKTGKKNDLEKLMRTFKNKEGFALVKVKEGILGEGWAIQKTQDTSDIDIITSMRNDHKRSQLTKIFNKANKKPEIETQARLGKRGPEAEARLPGVKGDESIVPGQDENIDDVPLSEFSPQGKQDAADTQKLVDKGVDPREAVKEVSNNQTMVSNASKQGRQTNKQPEIKTLPSEFRDKAQEVRDLIVKQNAKIEEVEIRKKRAENLLGDSTVADIVTRSRGIITFAEEIEMAKSLNTTDAMLLSHKPGDILNSTQSTALVQSKKHVANVQKDLDALGERIAGNQESFTDKERQLAIRSLDDSQKGKNITDLQLVNLARFENNRKLIKLEMIDMAIGSEQARALNVRKADVTAVDLRMRSIYNRIQKMEAEDQAGAIDELAKIDIDDPKAFIEYIESIDSADGWEMFAEWTVMVKLFNPTTQVVNLGGNALRQVADIGVTIVEAAATGDATLLQMDAMGSLVGLRRGMQNAIRVFTDEGFAREQSKRVEAGGSSPAIKGFVGKWSRALTFKPLTAGDALFKGIAYDRAVYRHAWLKSGRNKALAAKLIHGENLTIEQFKVYEEVHQKANKEAEKMTFQEDMGEVIELVNRFRDPAKFKGQGGKAFATFARSQLPFLKTPVNIAKQGFGDFMGLSLINHLTDSKVSKSDKIRRTSEAVLGWSLMAMVAAMFDDGDITGAPPRDKKERTRFYDVEKKLPYSMRINGKWVQYKRVEPFAIVMGAMADILQMPEDQPTKLQWANHIAFVMAMQMQDKTYLSGIGNMLDVVAPEDWRRSKALSDVILSNVFPSIIPHVARSMDSTVKESKRMSLTEGIRSRIPGLSKQVTPMVSVYGNDVTRANKGFNYFINPIQIQDAVIDDPVSLELINLDHMISLPGTRVGLAGENIQLNRDQYELYSRMIGTVWHNVMLSTVQTAAYKNLGREDRIKIMDSTKTKITRISSKFMASEAVKGSIIDEAKLGKKITDEAVLRILGRGAPPPRFVK